MNRLPKVLVVLLCVQSAMALVLTLASFQCTVSIMSAYLHAPRPIGLGGLGPATLSLLVSLGENGILLAVTGTLMVAVWLILIRSCRDWPEPVVVVTNYILLLLCVFLLSYLGLALLAVQYSPLAAASG